MEIKLFSLTKKEPHLFADEKRAVTECASSFSSETEKFKNYSSPKRMLLAVSQALRSADVVIIAVQSSNYNSAKKMICSALGIDLKQDEDIYSALLPVKESGKITQGALLNNSMFPKEADIFATGDFKCCGFSVTSGAQSIIVLPLDSIKTAEIVFGSLYDYLGDIAGVKDKKELARLKRYRLAQRTYQSLKKSGEKISFAPLGGKSLIDENIRLIDKENEFMSLGEAPEARQSSQSVKEYITAAAQAEREKSGCDYAGVVSSAFASNTDDSVFIFYAVADKENTHVIKLYANEDENPKALTAYAVERMFETAGDIVITKFNEKESAKPTQADRNLRQKISAITAFAIGGSAAICAVLALILGGQ